MVNESNKTIFKSLFINLALSPVTTMKNLDFSVILQQRRLCSFKNQCHKHVLFNVCTAFVTFLCRKNTLQHLEHPSLKVIDDFRWSSWCSRLHLEHLCFSWIPYYYYSSSSSSSSSSPSSSFCVHGFSKTTARIDLKLYIHTHKL